MTLPPDARLVFEYRKVYFYLSSETLKIGIFLQAENVSRAYVKAVYRDYMSAGGYHIEEMAAKNNLDKTIKTEGNLVTANPKEWSSHALVKLGSQITLVKPDDNAYIHFFTKARRL